MVDFSKNPGEVYILQHTHIIEEDNEDVKIIGIYSSEALAISAAERAKTLPGFSDTPDGFDVDKYLLDENHWTEGFITVY